jgi:hypothetical protein
MYNVWQTAKDDKTIRNRANEDLRIEQNLQEYMYHRLSVVTFLIYVGMPPRLPLYKFILFITHCQGKHLNLEIVYFFLYHERPHTSDVNIVH